MILTAPPLVLPGSLLGGAHLNPAVARQIDRTIARLAAARFSNDPLLPWSVSRFCSVAESAKKRHGKIIEAALICAIRELSPLEAWSPGRFRVPEAADSLANLLAAGTSILGADVAYTGIGRPIQIDMLVYNRPAGLLRSYEIKRAHGVNDAGKIRSMVRDLQCVQALLASFGRSHGLTVERAEARILFWYGRRCVPAPWSLVGTEIDGHFGCGAFGRVEQASAYFRARLLDLLEADKVPAGPQRSLFGESHV